MDDPQRVPQKNSSEFYSGYLAFFNIFQLTQRYWMSWDWKVSIKERTHRRKVSKMLRTARRRRRQWRCKSIRWSKWRRWLWSRTSCGWLPFSFRSSKRIHSSFDGQRCALGLRYERTFRFHGKLRLFIYFFFELVNRIRGARARFNDTRLVVFDGSDEVTDQREENGDAGDDPVASCVDALPADDAREVLRQQFPSAETQQTVAGVG